MPKRRAHRLAKPLVKDSPSSLKKQNDIVVGHKVMTAGTVSGSLVLDGAKPIPLSPVDDEAIDYSDIPDVGDDDAYWTGGRVGPVLPVRAAERPS